MRLTPAQHRDIARRAQWYFDCYFGQPGDSVVFTGDGIDDLDDLIARLVCNGSYNFNRNQRFMCDVGTQYSDWRPFDVDDVSAIKTQYVDFYGTVSKPDVYTSNTISALS